MLASETAANVPQASREDALAEFRENVSAFAAAEVAPHADAIDRANSFPKDVSLWQRLGAFGLLGASFRILERASGHAIVVSNNTIIFWQRMWF